METSTQNLKFLAAAGTVQQAALKAPDAKSLQAWGKAQLLLGAVDGAIDTLEAAVAIEHENAEVFSDLAAAYVTRAQRTGRAADWPQALEAAERAIELESTLKEALFNKALVLSALKLKVGAKAAWQVYLDRDRDSPWSEEARRQLESEFEPGASIAPGAMSTSPQCTEGWSDQVYENADKELVKWARSAAGGGSPADHLQLPVSSSQCLEARAGENYYRDLVHAAAVPHSGLVAKAILTLDEAETARARPDLVRAAAIASELHRRLPKAHPVRLRSELIIAARLYNDGRMSEVTELLTTVIRLSQEAGYQAIRAQATGVLAGVFYTYGDYDESLVRHTESVSIYRKIGFAQGLVSAELYASEAARALGDYDTAWDYHYSALARGEMLKSLSRRQALMMSPMVAALFQGLPRVSLNFGLEALARARASGSAVHNCDAGTNIARALSRIGKLDAASDAMAAAAVHCQVIQDPGIRVRALGEFNSATAEIFALDSPARSEEAAKTALALYEQASWQQRLPQVYRSLGIALRQLDRLQEAKEAFERGVNLIEAYQADVASRENRISYIDGVWDLYGEQVRMELELGDEVSAFETADRSVGRTLRSASTVPAPVLQSRLRPGEVLLLSVVTEDRVILFALTGDSLRVSQHFAKRDVVVRTVRWLSLALSSPDLDQQAETAARTLSELLLIPFEDAIQSSSVLYVVADPALQGIPYSFLPWTGHRAGNTLIDKVSVVMCPSASLCVGDAVRESPRAANSVAILRQRDGERLPRLDWEVEEIGKLYGNATVVDATAEVFRAKLADSDIVHYAGHAFVDPGFAQRSALLLPPDDHSPAVKMAVNDVVNAGIRTRLIVLSACSTLRGKTFRGEGMVAASTTFLARGALNVLGTLWDVRDDAASPLMVAFHQHVSQGVELAKALRLAQLRLKSEGRRPRDWAYPVLITRDAHSM